jgi:dihydroorotate dehydrogenase electron transfer subunit
MQPQLHHHERGAPRSGRLGAFPDQDDGFVGTPVPSLVRAPIVEHRYIADRYWLIQLEAPSIAAAAQPGQFVMMSVNRDGEAGPTLPRPMALYGWDATTGMIDVLYGVVGPGTMQLTTYRAAESLRIVGPLGKGFRTRPDTSRALLVGRGIGNCSLTALALSLCRSGVSVVAVDSARNTSCLVGDFAYREMPIARIYRVVDEDGSSDPRRLRARLIADHDPSPPQQLFTCGSNRLIDLCAELSDRWQAELQLSLEAHMACGLGYCHGCSSGQRNAETELPLICRDGPVFRWVTSAADE